MRTCRHFLALAVAMLVALALNAPAAKPPSAEKKPAKTGGKKTAKVVSGEDIFDNKTVLPIRITIDTNELKALQRDDRHYVRATVYEGTNVWKEVGVHIKGAAGSRRGLDDKPALTLSFGKFTPEQKFHGLRKIHLNNSVQDASYMTENICGELYRLAGVPAARVSYATLELNGKKKGFYVIKEGFAKEMLALSFKNTHGNLYDGGFLREITEQLQRESESDQDVKDWSDLKRLAAAAINPNANTRFDELSKVLDMDRFLTFCTLQIMTWDWDGYVMNRNNYRVYHDLDTGRMVFFPHGMDQMFWEKPAVIIPPDKFNGLVARAVIDTPQGRQLYRERFGQVFTNVFQIGRLTNRVDELAALIRPYAGNTNEYENQVRRMRSLIVAEHANLERRLSEPEPTPLLFPSGVASVTNWAVPLVPRDPANAIRDRVNLEGRHALHIATTNKTTNTTASWRASVMLGPGTYRFEALAKCAGIVPTTLTNDLKKGEGAGIRLHASATPRANKLVGDAPWQKLEYGLTNQFNIAVEFELLCELRALAGEVWFDADSLRLVKTK